MKFLVNKHFSNALQLGKNLKRIAVKLYRRSAFSSSQSSVTTIRGYWASGLRTRTWLVKSSAEENVGFSKLLHLTENNVRYRCHVHEALTVERCQKLAVSESDGLEVASRLNRVEHDAVLRLDHIHLKQSELDGQRQYSANAHDRALRNSPCDNVQ